jgi:N-methylhydantoinase B/oxoprolinase/acetone carboxylase alpha subunit
MNLSAEVAELCYPVVYEAFDIRTDSAGAGLNRGGMGARLQFRFKGSAELSIETSRTIEGSSGVEGGMTSAVQKLYKVTTGGANEVIGGWCEDGTWKNPLLASYRFQPGESFRIETTGGGGWGDPTQRAPEKVREDVLDGYVSIDAAREHYGVVIEPGTQEVDQQETRKLRD